jgi:hypothetical protein
MGKLRLLVFGKYIIAREKNKTTTARLPQSLHTFALITTEFDSERNGGSPVPPDNLRRRTGGTGGLPGAAGMRIAMR